MEDVVLLVQSETKPAVNSERGVEREHIPDRASVRPAELV